MTFLLFFQDEKDRHFPYANVTMKQSVYSLLEFYNDLQIGCNDGSFYDQKFVKILLCGILGVRGLAGVDLESENKISEIDLALGE